MSKANLIAGLDIGSGKITAVSAFMNQETGKLEIVSGASVDCSGLRNGIVTDIRQVSTTVANILNQFEQEAKQDLNGIYVALRGEHLSSEIGHGNCNISRADREITAEDIKKVLSNASSISIKSNNEIVDIDPQGFSIDGQKGFPNPEGMEGSSLEVDVYITTGLSSVLNNLRKSIQKAGYSIEDTFYGLVCLCESVLQQEEKDIGVVLIDLGGETTSIGICVDGALKYSKEFNFGCDLVTRDIACAWRTPRASAAKIKEQAGFCFPKYNEEELEEEIKVPSLDGQVVNSFKKSYLLDVIAPRMQDIFEVVKATILESGFADFISIGILTGGASQMPGIESLAAQILGKEIRRSNISRDLVEAKDEFFGPKYTTAIALLLYVSKREILEQKKETEISKKSPIVKWCKNIYSEIFGG